MSVEYSEEEIKSALEAYAEGQPITEICEQYGITQMLFSSWLATYSHLFNALIKPSVANNVPIIYPPDLDEEEEKKQVKSSA